MKLIFYFLFLLSCGADPESKTLPEVLEEFSYKDFITIKKDKKKDHEEIPEPSESDLTEEVEEEYIPGYKKGSRRYVWYEEGYMCTDEEGNEIPSHRGEVYVQKYSITILEDKCYGVIMTEMANSHEDFYYGDYTIEDGIEYLTIINIKYQYVETFE